MTDILEVAFQRVEGTECYAPYVDATAWDMFIEGGSSEVFKMRVDSGADISCIPGEAVAGLEFMRGRSCRVRSADGGIRRVKARMVTLGIQNGDDTWIFRPRDGVLVTRSDIGLLGMDILGQLSMLMMDETVILERKGN